MELLTLEKLDEIDYISEDTDGYPVLGKPPKTLSVLVNHPDYEELIPGTSNQKHGHIQVYFDAFHRNLGHKFSFKHFQQPGFAQVGDRIIQIYLRDPEKEQKLKILQVYQIPKSDKDDNKIREFKMSKTSKKGMLQIKETGWQYL